MWQAIQYVGTPLAFLAFLAAIAAHVYRVRASNLKALIANASEESRPSLIEGALRDFKVVDTADLTKAQRYDIVLKSLEHRQQRLRTLCYFSIAIFLVLCTALVAFSLVQAKSGPAPNMTWESVNTYRGLRIQKPLNWYLVNDGESPTFSIENPNDDAVYITVTPLSEEDYENEENKDWLKLSCEHVRNISAGSRGPEPDGVATLKKCTYNFEGKDQEELVLYIHGASDYALRCGYEVRKAALYSEVCHTVVGTARYGSEP